MPGIASDRNPGVQVGPITTIGNEIAPTPAIGDLMDAFKQGFITVDDLQRRNVQNISTNDQLKNQLQASDFQRRLAPGAFQNAQSAQGLQASQIQSAIQLQPGATQLALSGQAAAQQEADRLAARTSNDAARHAAQVEDDTKRAYVDAFGHEPPKSFTIPAVNPEPVDSFDTWLQKEHGADLQKQINNFQPGTPDVKDREQIISTMVEQFKSGFPLNSKQDNEMRSVFEKQTRADMESVPLPDQLKSSFAQEAGAKLREDPAVRTAYENYKVQQSKQTDKIVPGSPAYAEALRQRVQNAQDQAALRAAKLTAIPKILEEQAKAGAGDSVAKEKLASGLRDEISKDKTMNTLGEENKFARRILDLTDPQTHPTPSNADALAALEAYIKLLDPNAVIRQGKLVVTQEMTPKLQQIGKLFNRIGSTTGGFLSPNDITQLRGTTDTLIKATNREARQFLQVRANAATLGNIPFTQVFSQDQQNILSGGTPSAVAAPVTGVKPPPDGGPINRTRTSDGARFLWDGTTWVHQP